MGWLYFLDPLFPVRVAFPARAAIGANRGPGPGALDFGWASGRALNQVVFLGRQVACWLAGGLAGLQHAARVVSSVAGGREEGGLAVGCWLLTVGVSRGNSSSLRRHCLQPALRSVALVPFVLHRLQYWTVQAAVPIVSIPLNHPISGSRFPPVPTPNCSERDASGFPTRPRVLNEGPG